MTLLPARFQPLQRPLSITCLLIAAGAAVLAMSLQWRTEALRANTAAESRLEQLEARYQQERETNQMTTSALASWAHYLREGLSTTPDRVGWIERIQNLAALSGIAITDYEFSPDIAVNEQQEKDAPTALINLTPLRIRAAVDHEERFIELLSVIRKIGQANVQQCSLFTPDRGDAESRPQGLEAKCRFILVSPAITLEADLAHTP